MDRRQKLTVSIIGITLIVLTLLGITYAYYLTRIEGNTNENSISITTAKLELLYGDGNEDLSFERIMPGQDMQPKTFTVTNNGNSKIDNYAVALEEVTNSLTRTQDLTYTLTCVQKNASGVVEGTCEGKEGIFPNINSMIVVNSIDVGYVHEYSLKVVYENLLDVDQSIDMGSTIKAKVQIYGLTDTVDLEGTVSNYEDGDYVQINSVTKKSNIINGTYKLVGITPGIHTLKVCSKEDTVCSNETAKMSKTIVINKGETASVGTTKVDNVDVPLITITSDSRTSTVGINVSTKNIDIDETITDYDPNEGILTVNFTTNKNINLTTNKIVEDVDIKTDAVSIPFSIKNISDKHQNITIKLTDIVMDEALKNVDFRWGLYNADTEVGLSFGIFKYTEDEELIYTDTIIDAGTVTPNNYKLRIWVHNNGTAQTALLNKNFKAKVSVSSDDIEYTDESCFEFDESTGNVTKYDSSCGTKVVIPKKINNINVTEMHPYFFGWIPELESVIIPKTVTTINSSISDRIESNHLTIPESVTYFRYEGGGLKTLFIPESITTLNFSDISQNIKTLILPGTLDNNSLFDFYGNDMILMDGINKIMPFFCSSSNITSIEFPKSVNNIINYSDTPALGGCTGLTEIVVRGKTEAPSTFNSDWNCVDYTIDWANNTFNCNRFANVVYR